MATNYRAAVVSSALSYVGVVGGKKSGDDEFIRFYNSIAKTNFDVDTTPWCAIFVTYNLRKAGVPTTICPNFAGCTSLHDNFLVPKGLWKPRGSYTPKPGDLIMFNWSKKSYPLQHVGFVEKVSGSLVYTVEGNSRGGYSECGVRHNSYSLTSACIAGYGALEYEKIAGNVAASVPNTSTGNNITSTGSMKIDAATQKTIIKKFQTWMNTTYGQGLKVDGSCGPKTRAAAVAVLQYILNTQYNRNLTVDGSFGPDTKKAMITVKMGAKGHLTYVGQGLLYAHGYDAGGFDGSFGSKMNSAVKQYQTDQKINTLLNYGKLDATTWYTLCNKW